MGLRYVRASGGPNCFESPDVRVIDGYRDIPYTGALSAVLVPVDSGRDCRMIGLIFDRESTLIVDCLHSDDEIAAFRIACRENMIANVSELRGPISTPCPPPLNQAAVASWRDQLFRALRP